MNTSKTLTAADILAADDLQAERVEVPEWGGHIYIRPMNGNERDAFEVGVVADRERAKATGEEMDFMTGLRARTVALHACDEQGDLLFTLEQVEALGQKNAAALDRVFEKCRRMSGITDGDVEELEGN